MPETMKNRELYPIGTRVRIAQDKFSKKTGTVVEHSTDGQLMFVLWDGDEWYWVSGGYSPPELKEIKDA